MVEYSVPTTISPDLCPVDGVVHRNIGPDFFVHLLSRFWSIKFFKTSECESRIVGRSPNFAIDITFKDARGTSVRDKDGTIFVVALVISLESVSTVQTLAKQAGSKI